MKDKFEIKIEHGIPFEEHQHHSYITESLKKMKVGDSFLYPEKKRSYMCGNAMRLGIKLSSRKTGDGMVRVWRIK